VTAALSAPPEVQRILETSCYDCHSNQTRLPWFDRIVPAYWLVVDDVRRGRARLNFSEIGALPAAQQRAALYESVNQIRLGAMPPARYLLVHRGAAVDAAQVDAFQRELVATTPRPVSDPARLAATEQQRAQQAAAGAAPRTVLPGAQRRRVPSRVPGLARRQQHRALRQRQPAPGAGQRRGDQGDRGAQLPSVARRHDVRQGRMGAAPRR
jgi:hypothetical protein